MKHLVWFRNDLRLHDNEVITAAVGDGSVETEFLYVYDERLESVGPEGYRQIGDARRRFLAETLRDLDQRLRDKGARLRCLAGDSSRIVPALCARLAITDVFYARCTSPSGRREEAAVTVDLRRAGVRTHGFQTRSLICDEDVGDFDLYQPMSFSKLRKWVETSWPIRPPLPEIETPRASASANDPLEFPQWDFTRYLDESTETRGILLRGGESAALAHTRAYVWEGDHLRTYRQTRNGLLRPTDSSKFSPYLAAGCVSPRYLYGEVRKYEGERVKNSSTLWFLYELLWRDLFHFAATRHQQWPEYDVKSDDVTSAFEKWRLSRTGNRFVDAAMTELRTTGWLSNRMRQVAASYLIHDLKGDWRMGARWFESCLVDYDPCSNTGNWAYIAGAGEGQKPHVFDVEQQARMYDPDEAYRDYWA